ncbi:WGxxGxxG family protein [Kocuria marina]|uniref:WGxxGxxG family protein n=1 Tax=Kocuria marina TaxID=223184 RepID=UPI003F24B8EC
MMRKTAATAALSLAILTGVSAPAIAAEESPAPATSQQTNDDNGNAGLWGLLGLLGLAGLLKKNKTVHNDRHVDHTTDRRHATGTTNVRDTGTPNVDGNTHPGR